MPREETAIHTLMGKEAQSLLRRLDTGFPCHRIENFIRVRRIFGVGLGSLVIRFS